MTIRLLCAYDKYPANAIVTLDAGTETGLINAKMASANTAGGTPYVPPAQPNQLRPANLVYDATGTLLGLAGPNNTIIPLSGGATTPGQPAKPVLTAMAGAVSLAWMPGADGSTATTGNVWTDINGNTTTLTTNPQVITAPAGTSYTGTVKTQNAQGFGPASAQADAVTPLAVTAPIITTPTVVGSPAAYTTTESVMSQQWTLDGVDVSGATAATYTQTFADSAKQLRVRAGTANGAATSVPVTPGLRNMKLSNTAKLRAMLAGGVRGIILGHGDSCIAGYGAGGTSNELGMRPNAYLTLLAQKLTAAGIPASSDSSIGGGQTNSKTTFLSMDPRWVFGGATAMLNYATNTIQSTGGAMITMTANADTAKFTPAQTFDTCLVIFGKLTTSGAIQYSFDDFATVAGSINTLDAVAGSAAQEIACPLNSAAISFRGNGTQVFIIGVKTRKATVPQIEVINTALSGTTVQINARAPGNTPTGSGSNAFVPRAVLPLIDPAVPRVLFINGWINDRTASRTVQNVKDDYKIILDEAKARGDDIIYYGYAQFATSVISRTNYDLYEEDIINFLISNYDAVIVQNNRVFVTQEANTSYYADTLHLGPTGHVKTADWLMADLLIAKNLS